MKIDIDNDSRIIVSASQLSHFSRSGKRNSNINFLEVESEEAISSSPRSFIYDTGDFILSGIADNCYQSENTLVVEKIYERERVTKRTSPLSDNNSFSEGCVIAYLAAIEEHADTISLKITFQNSSTSTRKSFQSTFSLSFLKAVTDSLIKRANPFIDIEFERITSSIPKLKNLSFPYSTVREAQKEFITEAYRTIKNGDRLLVTAPTGVGKTISALYPALRAVGSGIINKVFYLTAKTETGIAAKNACQDMSGEDRKLRCVTIIAKERTCPSFLKTNKDSRKCLICPLMGAIEGVSYQQRRDAAIIELLSNTVIDTLLIQKAAEKYCLCPYELSLDASEYAEVVICDYNYIFEPHVRFKRYFYSDNKEEYVFLIDEAHNLPDRAREMYSSTVDTDLFLKLYSHNEDLFKKHPDLMSSVTDVAAALGGIIKNCREEELEIDLENTAGYYISPEIPAGLIGSLRTFVNNAGIAIKKDENLTEVLDEAILASRELISSSELFDNGFRFFAELINNHLNISIRCLDPSSLLDKYLSSAYSTILFSATLTPMDYFADILGCRYAKTLQLDSPYEDENLCIIAFDGISTRFQDRTESAEDIAEIILATIEAREGNYIAYFPSYEFMYSVYKAFNEMSFGQKAIIQSKNMNYLDRKSFLDSFKSQEGVVGFCVLGGVFSEGVDLKGERLIGSIIVGTGLPKLSTEQNILKDYFDTTREDGFSYAYRYPAMIKVLQAVGRVIRSEEDRGVAVLIDDRYGEPEIYRLFPKSWKHIKYTADPYSLGSALDDFWNN